MEESIKKILKRLSNDLSQININTFLTQIQNSTLVTECIDISLKFCETINNIKNTAYSGLSEELDLLKKNISEYEITNNIINNEIQILFNNLKNIITQNKTKIKSINTNISDIYTNLNLINSNIEKRKYSLASSRIEKILQIKNMILINIKQLDNNQQKLLDELKYDQFTKKMNHSSSTIKVRPAPTPFSPTSHFNLSNSKDSSIVKKRVSGNYKTLNLKDSKNNFTSAKKKIINRRNRDYSFSAKDLNNRSTSINNTLKEYSTITNFHKKNNNDFKLDDNKKEINDLKKKLLNQKCINDKLRSEIEKLKTNLNKSKNNNKDDYNLKNLSLSMSQNISFFNDKINKTSDLLFSLTFSFNSLQKKYNKLSNYKENEQDFSDIKKKLLNITTEISELKSTLLKITFETEEYNKNMEINPMNIYTNNTIINNTNQSINFSNNLTNSGNITNSQILESNNNLENSNIESLIDSYKSQVLTLTNKLSMEQQLKENLKNKNDELLEKLQKINKTKKIHNISGSGSTSISINKEDNNTNSTLSNNNNVFNSSLTSNTKSNLEISALKEKLRLSENKNLELQSSIESKILIENLLKKNLEEIKLSYEQKIIKFKRKLEDKEKEIIEIKEQYENEEMNLLNKIKQDNKESIEKLKNLYENKIKMNNNNIAKEEINKLEEKYTKEITKLNDELIKMRQEKENKKNNMSLENSINLSLINNNNISIDEDNYKKQIEQLEEDKSRIENNLKNLELLNEKEKIASRENINKSMNEILSLKDEILKYKTNENKFNAQIMDLQRENDSMKNKLKIIEEEKNEYQNKNDEMKNEINEIQNKYNTNIKELNLLKIENTKNKNENNDLNNKINEIKKEKEKIEEEMLKIKDELENEKNKYIEENTKLNEKIDTLNQEKEIMEKLSQDIKNKLDKKEKDIITLITNNSKEKKTIIEDNKTQMEKLKKEAEDRSKMNEQFKEEITSLHKKIFELENSNKNYQNISINKNSEIALISNITHNFDMKKLRITPEIKVFYNEKKCDTNIMRKKSKNETNKDDEEESEEDEEYDDNENEDEFLEKMKKLNKKRKDDNEEMKMYRKENRKMLIRLEKALDEIDEFEQKMINIEEGITKKINDTYTSLKKYFNSIISDINISNNNKEKLISFMKLIQFSDDEINSIIFKSKKNLKFNIFK